MCVVQNRMRCLAGKAQIGGQPTKTSKMIANCPRTFALFLQFSDSAQLGVYGLRTASTIGSGPPAVRLASFCSTAVRVQITSARSRLVMGSYGSAKAKRDTRT